MCVCVCVFWIVCAEIRTASYDADERICIEFYIKVDLNCVHMGICAGIIILNIS